MQTVVADAIHPITEFSMSRAGRSERVDRTRLICSNSVHVNPFFGCLSFIIILPAVFVVSYKKGIIIKERMHSVYKTK